MGYPLAVGYTAEVNPTVPTVPQDALSMDGWESLVAGPMWPAERTASDRLTVADGEGPQATGRDGVGQDPP